MPLSLKIQLLLWTFWFLNVSHLRDWKILTWFWRYLSWDWWAKNQFHVNLVCQKRKLESYKFEVKIYRFITRNREIFVRLTFAPVLVALLPKEGFRLFNLDPLCLNFNFLALFTGLSSLWGFSPDACWVSDPASAFWCSSGTSSTCECLLFWNISLLSLNRCCNMSVFRDSLAIA